MDSFNFYLVYLSTVLSASIFNTINYVHNRKVERKIKKRKFPFKNNLSKDTKRAITFGDNIPSLVYLGSTILSLVPIGNVFIPELSNRLYDGFQIDDIIDNYFDITKDLEMQKRYSNGLSLKIMEECGFSVTDDFKKPEIDPKTIECSEEMRNALNERINKLYKMINPDDEQNHSIDEILMLSDKEFNKRQKKILKLTPETDLDNEKLDRIVGMD